MRVCLEFPAGKLKFPAEPFQTDADPFLSNKYGNKVSI